MGRLYLDATNRYGDPASTNLKYLRGDDVWAVPDSDHRFLDAAGEWSVPELKNEKIYGVTWADFMSDTKGVRTDAAQKFADPEPYVNDGSHPGFSPFDDISPWCDMVPETRGSSNVMVPIRKFWYLWSGGGTNLSLRIANYAAEGFHVSPAHMDRGDGKGERDVVYIGRYHSSGTVSKLQSLSGGTPVAQMYRNAARNASRYDRFMLMDWATWVTYQMLYLVEFADWNSQSAICRGCGSGSAIAGGSTDDMGYHTGTMEESRDKASARFQYRNVESPFGNVHDWVDGIRHSGFRMYTQLNPSSFSDSSGGDLVGTISSDAAFPSSLAISEDGGYQTIYPSAGKGSGTEGTCDHWSAGNGAGDLCVYVGGMWNYSSAYGMFHTATYSTKVRQTYVGSRLQELP